MIIWWQSCGYSFWFNKHALKIKYIQGSLRKLKWWEITPAFMVAVLMSVKYNLDCREFTMLWKRESSLESIRVVWSTEKGEGII